MAPQMGEYTLMAILMLGTACRPSSVTSKSLFGAAMRLKPASPWNYGIVL